MPRVNQAQDHDDNSGDDLDDNQEGYGVEQVGDDEEEQDLPPHQPHVVSNQQDITDDHREEQDDHDEQDEKDEQDEQDEHDYQDEQDNRNDQDDQDNKDQHGEGDDNYEIDEQELVQIAETALIKIAMHFIQNNTTVLDLYRDDVAEGEYDGNSFLVITPEVFVDGLK